MGNFRRKCGVFMKKLRFLKICVTYLENSKNRTLN